MYLVKLFDRIVPVFVLFLGSVPVIASLAA